MKRAVIAGMLLALCGLGAREGRAQGAMVRGQVVDEEGRPLAGVKVELQYLGKERQTFARSTNEKGGFVQVGLPSGAYIIQYTREGYLPLTTKTTITAGGLNEVPTETLKVAPKAATLPAAQGAEPEADVAKEVQETYAKAMEAASGGRLDESAALFKQVLEVTPNLAVARYNLGYIYSRKKDWPAAEAEFRRVIELQPERSDTYSALAVVCEATGRRREAVEVLSAASQRFERDAAFQYSAGIVFLNGGETALAEAALLKARDLDASKVETHYYLGTLAVGGGRVEEAASHLQTYLSLSGQNPQNLETARKLLEALKKPAKP